MHVGVILPSSFDGGVIRSTVNIVRMLALGARAHGDPLTLSFGYPQDAKTAGWPLHLLSALGVNLRPFRLERMPAAEVEPYYEHFLPRRHDGTADEYAVFNDGISNFEECDLWLIISDHLSHMLPPHKAYAVVCYDYVFRYVPEIWTSEQWDRFDVRARMTRHAEFVITTTQQTKRDVVSYVGYPADRVEVLPIEFDPLGKMGAELPPSVGKRRQVLWPTIVSNHENHLEVLDALERFLAQSDHEVVVVGFHTQNFDPAVSVPNLHPYVESVRRKVRSSRDLSQRMRFRGFVDDAEYQRLVQESDLLLHTSRFDNGSYTVIEAAWLGTAAVSARYAAMEEIAGQFRLPLRFFDATSFGDLERQLLGALGDLGSLQASLPPRTELVKHSYEHLAPAYWERFKAACGRLDRELA